MTSITSKQSEDLHKEAEKTIQEVPRAPIQTENEYPPWQTFVLIMIGLYVALFLVALDRIIISTAIPKITDDFKSIEDIGWYGSSYIVANCVTQLLFGRLYALYNTKAVFIISIVLFEAGSALCGAAPSSSAFIGGRVVAGAGSAGIFAGVIVLFIPLVPLEKRAMLQGLNGAIFGVSSVIGPLVGGAFTNNPHLTWRWCFYINLPIGAVSLFIITFFLHPKPKPTTKKLTAWDHILRLDPIGNMLFAPSIISLLLALQWGGVTYSWNDGKIIGLFVVFGVLFVAWIGWQFYNKENANLPPRIMLQRSILSGFFFAMCVGGVMLTVSYYMAIWFQAIQGVDPLTSGIRQLPFILPLVFASILSGFAISKIGYYTPFIILCSCLMSIGGGLLTTLKVDSSNSAWIGFQFILGFGMGLGMQQTGLAAQAVLKREDVPIGVSVGFLGQGVGGAAFLSAAQNVFLRKLINDMSTILAPDQIAQLTRTGATQLKDLISPDQLPGALVQYNKAITATFVLSVALACISIIPATCFEWKNVKNLRRGGPPGVPSAKQSESDKPDQVTKPNGSEEV